MHKPLLAEQLILGFDPVFVRNTAIYRAHRSTLGFFVKAHTLGALIRGNEIYFITDGHLKFVGVHFFSGRQGNLTLQRGAIAVLPFLGAFVNRSIGALGLTGSAIDALVGYNDCHIPKYKSMLTFEQI